MITVLLLAVLGAVLSRWNSGPQLPWWKPGHTVKRVGVAGVLGIALFVLSGDPWTLLAGLALFVGLLMPWAEFQDFGRVAGSERRDFIGMTVVGGILVALPTAAVLAFAGYDAAPLVLVAAAFTGPAYWASWTYLDDMRWSGFIDGPTALGELARGFLIFGSAAWVVS